MDVTTLETAYILDDSDLNTLVRYHYDVDYEFAADMEMGNGTARLFKPRGDMNISEDEWYEFLAGSGNWWGHRLFDKMVSDGLIPSGNYVVNVSW